MFVGFLSLVFVRSANYCTGVDFTFEAVTVAATCELVSLNCLTLSVPVSYQHPTSPYIAHIKYDIH